MPTSPRTTMACLVLTAGLALAACVGTVEEAQSSTTTSPTTTSTASAPQPTTEEVETTTTTEPELSAEEQDRADVEETLQRYTRALDDAFNGDASVEGIYPFSRDTAREKWVTQVMADQAQGITSTGLTELEMVEVTIEGDSAEATACADVSEVDVFDENGKSIITEDRLDRTIKEFVLERDDSAELGWYVVEDVNRNEPCDG